MVFWCSRMIYDQKLAATARSEIKKRTGGKLLHFSPLNNPIIILFSAITDSSPWKILALGRLNLVFYSFLFLFFLSTTFIFFFLFLIIKDIGLVLHVAVCRTHCLSRDRGRDRENRIIAVIIFLLPYPPFIISLFFEIIITIHVADTSSTKQNILVTESGSQAR